MRYFQAFNFTKQTNRVPIYPNKKVEVLRAILWERQTGLDTDKIDFA